MLKRSCLWACLLLIPTLASAQPLDRAGLEAITQRYAPDSYAMLHDLLGIPNDAHFPDQLQRNLAWVREAFAERAFTVTELPSEGFPLLLAERAVERAARTVLVYLQIDGQPVDPSRWVQEDPFGPVLKAQQADGTWAEIPWASLTMGAVDPDWRVFARSASDAKGPVAMFLTALEALDNEGLKQTFNRKVIMDFEEEMGSPNLPAAVTRHKEALTADMLIIFDGPRHVSNQPSLTFGARGIATVDLTVYGPKVPQHSGHYGNYAPNPAFRLARLLTSMKDEAGRVTIPGYYDGITLDEATRAILAQVPDDEAAIQRALGIAHPDSVAETYQEAIQYPSLNVRGMASGWVDDAVRTIVPSFAHAEIDVRLTPETDPERLLGLIRGHIEDQGYYVIDREPNDDERAVHPRIASFTYEVSYGAFRTPYDSEVGLWLTAAMQRAFGKDPIRKRMSGGSIPISPFIQTLGLPAVTVPTVNADNNQHSPNENLRVGNYIDGIKTFLAILTEPFER